MLSLKFLYKNPIGRSIIGENKLNSKSNEIVKSANSDPNLEDDPQRAEYVRSIPKALLYKGLLLQGYLVSPKVLNKIEDIQIRDDDLWIITYPKSGTTWTEEIISLIYNNGNVAKVKGKLVHDRVVHLEVGKPFGHMKWINNMKSPRLLATHLPFEYAPNQVREAKCKIIYVIRNPKDNAVSYFHHHRMSTFLGNYKGSWSNFLDLFMKGNLVYGDWFEHVKGYWKLAQERPDRVLFISYEELKINLPLMIKVICSFVERPLSDEKINDIAKHCSFEEMKVNKMVNRESLPISDLFDMSQSKFMRKGIIGDWINHFTPQQNKKFDELYEEKMTGVNLNLTFDPNDAFKRMKTDGRIIFQNMDIKNELRKINSHTSKENHSEDEDNDTINSEFVMNMHDIPDAVALDICQ